MIYCYECIFYDSEWERCLEKHFQCRINPKEHKNCPYREHRN